MDDFSTYPSGELAGQGGWSLESFFAATLQVDPDIGAYASAGTQANQQSTVIALVDLSKPWRTGMLATLSNTGPGAKTVSLSLGDYDNDHLEFDVTFEPGGPPDTVSIVVSGGTILLNLNDVPCAIGVPHTYELSQESGRIRFWLDGVELAHADGFHATDVASKKFEMLAGINVTDAGGAKVRRVWFDGST